MGNTKKKIEHYELKIVSLDIPTSWQALSDKEPSQNDPVTRAEISSINNMLMDLMATMSYKDWISRRQRQKQGIERAHAQGKYLGKQPDHERHQKVIYYRNVKKLSIHETAQATGYSPSQVCRIQRLYFLNNEKMILITFSSLMESGKSNIGKMLSIRLIDTIIGKKGQQTYPIENNLSVQ